MLESLNMTRLSAFRVSTHSLLDYVVRVDRLWSSWFPSDVRKLELRDFVASQSLQNPTSDVRSCTTKRLDKEKRRRRRHKGRTVKSWESKLVRGLHDVIENDIVFRYALRLDKDSLCHPVWYLGIDSQRSKFCHDVICISRSQITQSVNVI